MTPAARVQSAIAIVDQILEGVPAEKALTNWARSARHAGSSDRAAIRDHVFSTLRRWWSAAAIGGGETGRARLIGSLHQDDADLTALFDGSRYGPAALTPEEWAALDIQAQPPVDCPPWLVPQLQTDLGPDFIPIFTLMGDRAPFWLRVNLQKGDLAQARALLAADGIETAPSDSVETALKVLTAPRKVRQSNAYLQGFVEIQDLSSQAITEHLPWEDGHSVLDFCAGGGGKALALAARTGAVIHAYDIANQRMRDIPARAARAGADIRCLTNKDVRSAAPFDLVIVDAPCSGSGAWGRHPAGKIGFQPSDLSDLQTAQRGVLAEAATLTAPGGRLAYITCSLLSAENAVIVAEFLAYSPDFQQTRTHRYTPLQDGDGFFLSLLSKS